jgi:cytidylate kinase
MQTENSTRIVIAVDGLSATGKTTLSRLLAKKLGFACLHSGLIYRAVALLVLEAGMSEPFDGEAIVRLVSEHQLQPCDGACCDEQGMLVDGLMRTAELRGPALSEIASKISALPEVRKLLFDLQRHAFSGQNLVAEGRDMGTVIFPDAKVKFFVNAAPAVRAQRRTAELATSGDKLLESELEKEIAERDARDQGRAVAPTVPAEGAIMIDNSSDSLTQVIEKMYESCRKSIE